MPPSIAPFLPKPNELDEAAAAAKKLALFSAATAAAFYAAPKYPQTVGAITEFLTGLQIKANRGVVIKPSFGAMIAPQPIGLVPPRMYGIPQEFGHPIFFARIFGYYGGREQGKVEFNERVEKDRQKERELFAANARRFSDVAIQQRVDELRARPFTGLRRTLTAVSDIEQAAILIAEQNARAVFRGEQFPPYVPAVPPPSPDEVDAANAKAGVIGLAGLTAARNFLSVFSPAGGSASVTGTGPFGASVTSASIPPEGIEPVADAAKRNAAAAKGIRRQLVSERADP
jgi:hypothetical protein